MTPEALNIACCGARNHSDRALEICQEIGNLVVSYKHNLHVVNGPGADQAFTKGANVFAPQRVYLHQPWLDYNVEDIVQGNKQIILNDLEYTFYEKIAIEAHPHWERCNEDNRKIMIRYGSLIMPPPTRFPVDQLIVFPLESKEGESGQAMRIAKPRKIPIVNLQNNAHVKKILKLSSREERNIEINYLIHETLPKAFWRGHCGDTPPIKGRAFKFSKY